ncbi:F-box/kelch-repeat protein At3g23880 [Spinacia oleracea]|uniref:F-box/kelch-repeat protein At3g23880 n=1 Tax=Spinacia oleracea TaxID=3562 RepID=A0A9R0I5Q6_SPIOL|nr:F-box/kelch-repeat protein At3g23880-like [Spinacia oleracea]
MKQMSEKLVNTSEYEEDITSLKTVLRRKPHRKVVSGLRLLTESCKITRPGNNVISSKVKHGEEGVPNQQQSELPLDVLMHQILARLPIKSLLQSKSVSKQWYSTVSSNDFADVYFKTCPSSSSSSSSVECLFIQAENSFYLFYLQEGEVVLDYSLVKLEPNFENNNQNDDHHLHLVGSCNGLVCLSDSSSSSGYFYVWNPIAYHYQKFPENPDFCLCPYNYCSSWGFAYVSSVNDYKVVRIAENYDTQEIIVSVFSLQTKEWKQVHEHGLDLLRVSITRTNPGVLLNNTLFWIMESRNHTKNPVVVGFDLKLEKFGEVPGIFPRSKSFHDHFLCVMGGCLTLCSSDMHKESCLSIMKRTGEVESISMSCYSKSWLFSSLVGFTRSGKSLVVSKNWELALVDLSSSSKQYIPLVTFKETQRPCMVGYFPSLIPPL